MTEYLFSYGTLQKEETQLTLFNRKLAGEKDLLIGYTISPVIITDAEFLAKGEQPNQLTLLHTGSSDDRIEGTVFIVSKEELLYADKYEPVEYKRIKVVTQSGKEAWVYAIA